jgi:membrane protein required for colicin V production
MWNLSLLDWLFLTTILCSIGIGAYRGWLPQALSMVGFVAAFVAVVKLGPSIGAWLPLGGPGEAMRDDMGALIAVIVTLLLGHQAVVLHRKLFTRSGPQPAHRTLGGIFGMISGVFILLAISAIIDLTAWRESSLWKGTAEESVTRFLIDHMKSSVKPSEISPST